MKESKSKNIYNSIEVLTKDGPMPSLTARDESTQNINITKGEVHARV